MNIQKLYTICSHILGDFSRNNIAENLQDVVTHLQNSINQPQQPNHQQALSESKKKLYAGLQSAESNSFNIIDLSAVQELGIESCIGEPLLERINVVFTSNELTPSLAHEELTRINEDVTKSISALKEIVAGFDHLDLNDLETSDEFRLVVRIPGELMDNNLAGFSRCVESLDSNLLVFSEVATGSRESFEIGSLSSSDPTLVLNLAWDTGVLILDVLAKIAAIYGGVSLLKQNRRKFIEDGAPEETLAKLTDWINSSVKEKIAQEIPPLIDKYYPLSDENRKNELKIEARRKALRIAENIDDGYTFDIKAPTEEPAQDDQEISEAINEAIAQLNQNNRAIEANKLVGQKILALPEQDEYL